MQEKSKNKKEKWVKPILTVLVRGKVGERLLQTCKMGFAQGWGPNGSESWCQPYLGFGGPANCGGCGQSAAS